MLDEQTRDNIARIYKCAEGSLIYYNKVAEFFYKDIIRIEKRDSDTIRIVCKPDYDIDDVLDFAKNEVFINIGYEIVVETDYNALEQGC